MENIFIIRSIFFFMFFWAIAIILLWFRPRIEVFWKIAATLLFGLYIWFFWQEIVTGYQQLIGNWQTVCWQFLKDFLIFLFVNSIFIWPVIIFYIFYSANDFGAERWLKFICIFTICIWIAILIVFFVSKSNNEYIFNLFNHLMPNAN